MAVRTWTGAAGDGDWNNNANWDSAKPAAGDDAIFSSGSSSVTTGLDQSAVDAASIFIGRGYTGNIGSSGNPVNIGIQTKLEIDGGGNEIHFGTGGTYNWEKVVISYPGVNGNGNVSLTATQGAVFITIARGQVSYTAGTTTLLVLQHAASGGNPVLSISGGTLTTFEQLAGTSYLSAGTVTTHRMAGGNSKIIGGTYTNCYQYGGNVTWNNSGTLTLLHGFGGFFDASRVQIARTITTLNGYAGFTFSKNPRVTVTNDFLNDFGGQLIPYVGSTQRM